MESSQLLASVHGIHEEARRRGLFFQTASDPELHGRTMTIDGREMVSFSSCSYLGLEHHRAVRDGVHAAVEAYGTQFSCSRGYVSAPIYGEIEGALGRIFDGHVLVTPSTTMAHLAALPVLATERDAIVIDHQAHHSVHMGANQARAGGARVEVVRHDELERACSVIRQLAQKSRTVWFCTDGVFSMYGDLAPLNLLREILDVAPNVRLYVDDAHGMSWAGRHGRGSFLDRLPLDERVVVATSFAKGFGAGGGCLVFADPAERDRVQLSGGPLVFSGPMQPPMMGAVLASARIHLSPEITTLQQALADRTRHVNTRLAAAGIPPLAVNESPIFFLHCGLPRVAFSVAERLAEEGIYVCCSVYPTVPMKRAGIRFTVTSAHTYAEIDHAIDRLALHLPAARAAEGVSEAALVAMFRGALPSESAGRPTFSVETAETIRQVDRATWDAALGTTAHCSWDAMAAVEAVFGRPENPRESRWTFRYVVVRNQSGKPVAVTFFTTLLQKDDMFSRAEVSAEVEARRVEDPYFLTSNVVMMGCNLSEGNHLWIDRDADWREAIRLLLAVGEEEVKRAEATALIVRDLPGDDPELDAFMLEQGLARVPTLDTHEITLDGRDEAAWFASLDKKKRQQLKPVLAAAGRFETTIHGAGGAPLPPEDIATLHALYSTLAQRKLRLNLFSFPDTLLPALLQSPAWEIGVMRLRTADGLTAPVAFWAAHHHADRYAPLLCGIDDAWRATHEPYRAMLLAILRRAREVGTSVLRLGMDAELEKRRLGARTVPTCVYAQVRDHYAGAQLREIVAQVAVRNEAVAAK